MSTNVSAVPTPLYELSGVTKTYGEGPSQVSALSGVDLTIVRGELLAIVGPSGSGKTTMLQLLGGLDRPSAGLLAFEGQDLGSLGDAELALLRLRTFGFVFQQFNLIPTLTAQENVEAALAPLGGPGEKRHARSLQLLESVGLGGRVNHLPSQLSGGEQQRVAIARALANEPDVIMADEPTGNLDTRTGEEIIQLLRGLSEERGQTVVIITHDDAIAALAQRVVRLSDGRLAGSDHAPEAAERG
jgi:putative ABC transport system ATP-binding protein